MSETVNIKYILKFPDEDFTVDLDFLKKDFSLVNIYPSKKEWTRLENHKCSHCPLSEKQSPFCPLASAIDIIISKLKAFLSYDEVHVRVEYKHRKISADITVQRALSSLLGLVIPASGCPYTVYFRPMLRFHLPFADTEETLYRATSMFLLAQYFLFKKENCIPTDFSKLETIYNNVHTVNSYICRRLREVSEEDCYLNAIVILDMFSLSIHATLEHGLERLESYFSAYREDFAPPSSGSK